MKPFYRDNTHNVCFRGLKEDCGGPYVNGATIKAAVLAPNQSTVLQGDVDILPAPGDGAYKGTIPATDPGVYEFVYFRIMIDNGPNFQTIIWEPRVVADRSATE